MYLEFFEFRCPPFGIAPDPEFLYLSPQHEEALAHLRYGIDQRKGIIVLTGEVGCGKTTLCEALLRDLPQNHYTCIEIGSPYLDEQELYGGILKALGKNADYRSPLDLLNEIGAALQKCSAEGKEVVLCIDEAQGLSPRMLEQIRLLSNLETSNHKVLQILLIGQPELRKCLKKKELRQLRQRVLVYYNLKSLNFFETLRYVKYRLACVGGMGRVQFNFRALIALYRASRGIPRIINNLCDRALLSAFVRNSNRIAARDMHRAIRDLRRL